MRFGVMYDLRNPPQDKWFQPWPEFYAAALEHMEEVERLGYEVISFSEHHGDVDGTNPAMFTVLGSLAQRTKTARIGTNILQLPFHHPVVTAEELAVLDVISGGRVECGFGLVGSGFDHEFHALGLNPKHRRSLSVEAVEIIRRCWTEDEPFSYQGKRYQLEDVWINPKPVQKPYPPIWMPAFTQAGIDRVLELDVNVGGLAGGYNFGLTLPDAWPHWRAMWLESCERHGKDPANYRIHTFGSCYPTDDPERAWAEHRDSALYHFTFESHGTQPYVNIFLGGNTPKEPEELPMWDKLFRTPEDAVAEFTSTFGEYAPDEFQITAKRPGMSWEASLEYLTTFAEKVIPQIRDVGRPVGG
jgi:alkanesulfonate monooxygenase SsuD/methylene tetrahydromethanopterin reductase-like flavin-dependent oxidoreductase (luciferase family)